MLLQATLQLITMIRSRAILGANQLLNPIPTWRKTHHSNAAARSWQKMYRHDATPVGTSSGFLPFVLSAHYCLFVRLLVTFDVRRATVVLLL